jgi:hypothetical protein
LSSLLLGGAETDILDVGEGNDTLTGGESGDFVAARDEISDFISKSPDGVGGLNYLIDLDGGGATFSPVVFLHFVQFQVPVWFQADNEQQGI